MFPMMEHDKVKANELIVLRTMDIKQKETNELRQWSEDNGVRDKKKKRLTEYIHL